MEFLLDYGLFLAKLITILIGFALLIAMIIAQKGHSKGSKDGHLEIIDLSEAHQDTVEDLTEQLSDPAAWKVSQKQKQKKEKKEEKERQKQLKSASKKDDELKVEKDKPRLFVLDFKGSIDAKEVAALREEITAIIAVANPDDTVLCRLESGGGVVHGYGLASSQLKRLRDHSIELIVSVDKVAASGGYMMTCVANKIIAAPFAIIGSIGVIAQIPNFNRLLKKNNIDFEMHTAGDFKRTLTMFGENNDKGREKFQEELEETHSLFKEFILDFRPQLDIAKVATGEHWYGKQAQQLDLIDEIKTSDDYLLEQYTNKQVLQLQYVPKKNLSDKLKSLGASVSDGVIDSLTKTRRFY